MKATDLRVKIFHCFLALTLVMGLMVPTFNTMAYGEGVDDAAVAGSAQSQSPDAEGSIGGAIEETAQGDGAQAPDQAQGDDGDAGLDAYAQQGGQDAGADAGVEPSGAVDDEGAEAEGAGSPDGQGAEGQPVTALDGTTTWNGLTIKGGVSGVDFETSTAAGNLVTIKTSTPLELSGTFSGSIQVQQNIEAWVTFNGLTVTATTAGRSPFNLLTPTTCHVTLADNSVNTLRCGTLGVAAMHCGDGSTLYIDDGILNYLSDGTHVEVLNGVIDTDGTLQNGTVIKKGDLIDKVSSSFALDESGNGTGTVGKLDAIGGYSAAAIGSGPAENAGNMIFDGGWIIAKACGSASAAQNSAAGIGAGGAGGATDMTFNAATVDAYGSYHGAGIGASWSSKDGNGQQYGAATTAANLTCGNININGGYLKAQGYAHGNAFGGACGTTANGKTIKITGGTLLPTSVSGKQDIGGSGGKVIIDGGSVKLTGAQAGKPAPSGKFQSSDNKAYNSAGEEMFLLCIDLKTSDKIGTEPVANWELRIGGAKYEYGTPSYFDDGRLYLWLPNSANGKEVTIKVAKYDEDGNVDEVEDLTSTPTGGGDLGKRWIDYSIDDFLALNAQLTDKYYDGSSIETVITALEDYTTTTGIPAPYGANKDAVLKDGTQLEYQAARTEPDGKTLLSGEEYLPSTASHDHAQLPVNSGTISVLISSKEFASVGTTSQSFWGHRTNMVVNVHPVTSRTTCQVPEDHPVTIDGEDYVSPVWVQDQNGDMGFATATNNHLVVPVDVASHKLPFGDVNADGTDMSNVSCAAPTGKLQLHIDGVEVPARLGGVVELTDEGLADGKVENMTSYADADGRAHSQAYFDLDRRQINAFFVSSDYLDNNDYDPTPGEDGSPAKHQILVTYDSTTVSDPLPRGAEAEGGEEAGASVAALAQEYGHVDESAGVEFEPAWADYAYLNYYESHTATTPVEIKTVDPVASLYNDYGTAYDPAEP